MFQRLSDKVNDISTRSISFPNPSEKKGEYGAGIAALNAEIVLLSGRKAGSEEAKKFIRENVHLHVTGDEPIPLTINGDADATVEVALKRAIAAFSTSEDHDFLGYLRKILLENQILMDGNRVRINHVKFPACMTEKQMKAVKDRIQHEIRLYAAGAEVVLSGFPVFTKVL